MKKTYLLVPAGFICSLFFMSFFIKNYSSLPSDYLGKPYTDSVYKSGPQAIPGIVQCAYFDLGGEGVAYHDADSINHGSGELNYRDGHCMPEIPVYFCHFREKEGVDLSYTKDFADFNHPNLVTPQKNQLYIGWQENGEWCNYTIDVKVVGTYRIGAMYGNAANVINFSLNNKPASECKLPLNTGSMHIWNKADSIGTIVFPETGLQLLTLHYNAGNNFAYFEFTLLSK